MTPPPRSAGQSARVRCLSARAGNAPQATDATRCRNHAGHDISRRADRGVEAARRNLSVARRCDARDHVARAAIEAAVAATAQAVVRGLVAAVAIKSAVLVLAVASFLSAGRRDRGFEQSRGRRFLGKSLALNLEAGAAVAPPKSIGMAIRCQTEPFARLGTTRFRHNFDGGNWGTVGRVSYTPDGRSLVTVSARTAKVWDIATEHLVQTIDADLWRSQLMAKRCSQRNRGFTFPAEINLACSGLSSFPPVARYVKSRPLLMNPSSF